MCAHHFGVPLDPLFINEGVSTDFPAALCNSYPPVPDDHNSEPGSSLNIHDVCPLSYTYHTYVYENYAESDVVDDLSQSRSDSDNDSSEFKDQCDDFMDQCEGDKSPNGFPTDINVSVCHDTTILNNCTAEVELNPPIANLNRAQIAKRQNRRIAARNQNASKFARCRGRVNDKYKRVRSVMELLDTNIPHNRKPKSVGELKSFVVFCSNLVISTNPAATNVLTFLDETMEELNNPVRE